MTDTEQEIPANAGHSESAALAAAGPLVVSTLNPRYFAVASDARKAVYLTGSHIWNNLHDGMGPGAECAETPEPLDFRELPRLPRAARPQLHPAVALGALQVTGGGG